MRKTITAILLLAVAMPIILIQTKTAKAEEIYQVVTLQAVADTFISTENPTDNPGSQQSLSSGFFPSINNENRRIFVKFDFTSIPPNATVSSASFNLRQKPTSGCGGTPSPNQLIIGQNTSSWAENTTGWNNKPSYSAWQSYSSPACPGGWYYMDTRIIVQNWVSGQPNYGFQVHGGNSTSLWYRNFESRDSSETWARPQLVVSYHYPRVDISAPVITGANVTEITSSSATINWSTNESSTKRLEWGPTKSYGNVVADDQNYATSFAAPLDNLSSGTTYYYRFKTKDQSSNTAYRESDSYTFSTTASMAPSAPPDGSSTATSSSNNNSATDPKQTSGSGSNNKTNDTAGSANQSDLSNPDGGISNTSSATNPKSLGKNSTQQQSSEKQNISQPIRITGIILIGLLVILGTLAYLLKARPVGRIFKVAFIVLAIVSVCGALVYSGYSTRDKIDKQSNKTLQKNNPYIFLRSSNYRDLTTNITGIDFWANSE